MGTPLIGGANRAAAALAALALLAAPGSALARSGDRDHDRMPDRWEKRHRLSTKKNDARRDRDRDGLRNLAEYRSRTNPRDRDSDNDGVGDADEDRDRDRVDNRSELLERTSPRDADSDDDRIRDGREDADRDGLSNAAEDATGNDPRDRDSDDDGVKDAREQAGTIVSLEQGLIAIDLRVGGSLKGLVTPLTEIACEDERTYEDGVESEDADAGDAGLLPEDEPGAGATDEAGNAGPDGVEPDGEYPGDLDQDFEPLAAASSHSEGIDGDEPGEGEPGGEGNHGDEPYAVQLDLDALGEEELAAAADEGSGCAAEDLVEGARVHEAELELTPAGLVFTEIELVL